MRVSKKQEWDGELIPAFTTLGKECSLFSTSRDNKAISEFTVKKKKKKKKKTQQNKAASNLKLVHSSHWDNKDIWNHRISVEKNLWVKKVICFLNVYFVLVTQSCPTL